MPSAKPSPVVGAAPDTIEHSLADGRSVVIRSDGSDECVQIHAADGELELTITLTEAGPQVRLSGAQLELEATDTVAIRARCVDVQATEMARMHADGHLTLTSGLDTRVSADGEVHVLGTMIWLN